MDHQPARSRLLDSKDVARKLRIAALALAALVGFTLVLAVVAAILNLIEDPPTTGPGSVAESSRALRDEGSRATAPPAEQDPRGRAGTILDRDFVERLEEEAAWDDERAEPEASGEHAAVEAADEYESDAMERPGRRGPDDKRLEPQAGRNADRDAPPWTTASQAPSDLRDAEFGFDAGGFGLGAEELEISGIHGTICNPRTGRPEGGLVLVVSTRAGDEITSPNSGPDGSYSLGLEPGILYHKEAILLPGGERHELHGTGLSFRIWDGRNLEVNACDFEDGQGAPAAMRRETEMPERGTSEGPAGFPTRIFGTVFLQGTERPVEGFRVVFQTGRGERVRSRPSGPDGVYQIAVEPGVRYEPVTVVGPNGEPHALREGLGGFRLQPGETLRLDVRDYD